MQLRFCFLSSLFVLTLWLCSNAVTLGKEITNVFRMAETHTLPPGAPKYSDVCMRNLRVYSAKKKDPYDTVRLIKDFHVTRLDWTYKLTAEFVEEANNLGVTVQGTVGSLLPRKGPARLNSPGNIGIENLNGGK